MSAEVVDLNFVAGRDTTPDIILSKAQAENLKHCIVAGWDQSGELFLSSSYAAGPEVLWLLEVAKQHLLSLDP